MPKVQREARHRPRCYAANLKGKMMSDFATLQVKTYRVVNDWLNKTLLETRDFDEACEEKAKQEALNQYDEIIVVAVIDA